MVCLSRFIETGCSTNRKKLAVQGCQRILRGCSTIHFRVKGNNELMHLKAYEVDDTILRDGSANWSISAVRYQDNQISIVSDPAQIEHFRQVFASMWERSDNRVVQ